MSDVWWEGECERENRCTFDQACGLYPTCVMLDPAGYLEEAENRDG